MSTQNLSISNALKFGFRTLFSNILLFISLYVLFYGLVFLVEFIITLGFGQNTISKNFIAFLNVLVIFYFNLGISRIALTYHDTGATHLNKLISPLGQFLRYIAAEFLALFVILITSLLIVAPGLALKNYALTMLLVIPAAIVFCILMARTLFIPYCIIDRNAGIIDAFDESWKITKGNTLFLVGYYIVCGIIDAAIITIPATRASRAFIYRKLSQTNNIQTQEI